MEEKIAFTIWTDDGEFIIPTMADTVNYGFYGVKSYDWNVAVDGQTPVRYTRERNSSNKQGIKLSGLTLGEHKIVITPFNEPSIGWGNVFGFAFTSAGSDADVQTNKNKVLRLDAPLTTLAFAPKVDEGDQNIYSNFFAYTFSGCTYLTTGAALANTYSLPSNVTKINSFAKNIHYENESLETPLDLSLMSAWLNKNNQLTEFSYFLSASHFQNFHLVNGVDLTPISNWFENNTSIKVFDNFMLTTYSFSYQLSQPTSLLALSAWFNSSSNLESLYYFMSETYSKNNSLFDLKKIVLPNWIKFYAEKNNLNLHNAFYNAFEQNYIDQETLSEPVFEDGSTLSSVTLNDSSSGRKFGLYAYAGRCGLKIAQNSKHWTVSDGGMRDCPVIEEIVVAETTTSPVAKIQMCPNLKYGEAHPCTKLLQEYLNANEAKLNKAGQVGSDKNETEYYCHYTERALIKFQTDNKIAVTGMFDNATKEKIYTIGDFYQSDYDFTKVDYEAVVKDAECPPGEWRTLE